MRSFVIKPDDSSSLSSFSLASFVPRYSFYPLYGQWPIEQTPEAKKSNLEYFYEEISKGKNTLVYLHIPYCKELCNFCGLNVKITKDQNEINSFASYLIKEISRTPQIKSVKGIVIGGGTPHILSDAQLIELFSFVRKHFDVDNDCFIQIEVDPRFITDSQLSIFREFQIKNLVAGVIDLNPNVLSISNRISGNSTTQGLALMASKNYFEITCELIAGLAHQSFETLKMTVDRCLEMGVASFGVYPLFVPPWNPNARVHLQLSTAINGKDYNQYRNQLYQSITQYLKSLGLLPVAPGLYARPDHWWIKHLNQQNINYGMPGLTPFKMEQMLSFGPSAVSSSLSYVGLNEKVTDRYINLINKNENTNSLCFLKNEQQINFNKMMKELFLGNKLDLDNLMLSHAFAIKEKICELKLLDFNDNFVTLTQTGREYFGHLLYLLEKRLNPHN